LRRSFALYAALACRATAGRPWRFGVIASLAPCPPLRRGRTAQLLPGATAYISDDMMIDRR